jgi:hypothetical protein
MSCNFRSELCSGPLQQPEMNEKRIIKSSVQTKLEALKAENDRLRRDNERFVRIIDSGEWGRGRVAELVQVLQLPCETASCSHFAP